MKSAPPGGEVLQGRVLGHLGREAGGTAAGCSLMQLRELDEQPSQCLSLNSHELLYRVQIRGNSMYMACQMFKNLK